MFKSFLQSIHGLKPCKKKIAQFNSKVKYINHHDFLDRPSLIDRSQNQNQSFRKVKIIKKAYKNKKEKEKQDGKRYDRGGNCVASNISKLFIKIFTKRLMKFPLAGSYLKKYQIQSQKENVLLIPLFLYSLLKQEINVSICPQGAYNEDKEKIFNVNDAKETYIEIIKEFKQHIQSSLKHSIDKSLNCPTFKKQFHQKNISIYNKILELIKKLLEISECFVQDSERKLFQKQDKRISPLQTDQKYQNSLKLQPIIDCKIEQEEPNQAELSIKRTQNSQLQSVLSKKCLKIYDLQRFQDILESLYERKQRQYQKAMDKIYSVIINERPLRELFQIYRFNIKKILKESVNYCFRRNINSRAMKNEKKVNDRYHDLQKQLVQALEISETENPFILRGWEFLLAFLALKFSGDKKFQIYEEFKLNIKRKTKYFKIKSDAQNDYDPRESFDSEYYEYSLQKLEKFLLFQQKEQRSSKSDSSKNRPDQQKKFRINLKKWLIGYFDTSATLKQKTQRAPKLNNIVLQPESFDQINQVNIVQNLQSKHEEQIYQLNKFSKSRNFFGMKQQKALEALEVLLTKFDTLLEKGNENFN